MTPERIAELLAPFIPSRLLGSKHLTSIKTYLDLLLKWNSKMNLTAVRDPEEIITRHFGESLFAAHQLFPDGDSTQSAIDIGSGPGFPGLPIKLWAERLDFTLVESNHRKATFLREVVRTLELKSVSVRTERAERIPAHADLVTLRAVETFERVLPIAHSLTKPKGRIAILIGSVQVEQARALLPEVKWQFPVAVPNSRSRVLLTGTK
ncbi:MAG TPA: 16S rRNA (guanine(527)-N(7))-methyltransferase RsmG [Terriglobales bacterium]|nr:16S rRNA (guanine(527)-N(7))-methyltransferase RsmG [Terriglobales bacterium]